MIFIFQLVAAIVLIGLVLMQAKGTGMTEWGNSTSQHTRRGLEKFIFRSTVVVASFFVLLSLLPVFGL